MSTSQTRAKSSPEKSKAGASLAERIALLRAETDAFIDARAALLKEDAPGVPVGVLRNLITNRAPGCACQATLIELEAIRVAEQGPGDSA